MIFRNSFPLNETANLYMSKAMYKNYTRWQQKTLQIADYGWKQMYHTKTTRILQITYLLFTDYLIS